MEILDRINAFLNRLLLWVGGVFLVGMIVLTCANIFFRLTWVPIKGTFELMGYCGAIVTAFALGYTQIKRGHIAVDVLVNTFSDKVRNIINAINYAVCFLFFSVAAWQIAVKATTLMNTGEITETLRIIYYPFTYGVAFGCAVLSLVLFTDLIRAFFPEKEGED
jgi:TRAP-type C4-dicarboxylate transport system permease small subunit